MYECEILEKDTQSYLSIYNINQIARVKSGSLAMLKAYNNLEKETLKMNYIGCRYTSDMLAQGKGLTRMYSFMLNDERHALRKMPPSKCVEVLLIGRNQMK